MQLQPQQRTAAHRERTTHAQTVASRRSRIEKPRGIMTRSTRRAEAAKHMAERNATLAATRRVHWADEDAPTDEKLAKEAEYVLAMFEMAWDGTLVKAGKGTDTRQWRTWEKAA